MQLNSSHSFHNYILTKEDSSHSFFLIELAEEPKNASIPLSYISYAFEHYTEIPTHLNSTNVTISSENSYGKTTLIIPINNTDTIHNQFIFSVFYSDHTYQYPINYIIKYKSSQTENDIVSYNFNTTFQAYHLRQSGYIYFEEIFSFEDLEKISHREHLRKSLCDVTSECREMQVLFSGIGPLKQRKADTHGLSHRGGGLGISKSEG